jgi:hypothetical protein
MNEPGIRLLDDAIGVSCDYGIDLFCPQVIQPFQERTLAYDLQMTCGL